MSERKVLNKYYPPDFDPSKIPKIKRPKNYRKGVFSIRLMAPFNMRCNTCGEYIYKGKKFNSRKETVENENYLGLHIFRFYIKCPRCIAEIAFKTDPESTDYILEAGATRNFEASRTAEKMALQEQKEKEAEEANNPMKVLENRTKASCQEMEMLETLEELRELRQKHAKVDTEMMLQQNLEEVKRHREEIQRQQEEEDEQFVRSIFGSDGTGIVVKRLQSDSEESSSSDASETEEPKAKVSCISVEKPTDILTQNGSSTSSTAPKLQPSWSRSVGSMSSKALLAGLVKPKATSKVDASATTVSLAKQPVTAATTANGAELRAESDGRAGLSSSSAGRLVDSSNAEVSGSAGTTAVKASASNSVTSSAVSAAKSSALAGLGAYSDSSEGDE